MTIESTMTGVHERRNGLERRSGEDRRLADAAGALLSSVEKEATSEAKRSWRSPLEITSYVVAAVLGLFVYNVTGLYDAAESVIVRMGLGAIIAFWFILNVRVALQKK